MSSFLCLVVDQLLSGGSQLRLGQNLPSFCYGAQVHLLHLQRDVGAAGYKQD